jgi:hypothetical protein
VKDVSNQTPEGKGELEEIMHKEEEKILMHEGEEKKIAQKENNAARKEFVFV